MTHYDDDFPLLVNQQGNVDEFTTTSGRVRIIFLNDVFDELYVLPGWQRDLLPAQLASEIALSVGMIQAVITMQRPATEAPREEPRFISETAARWAADHTQEALKMISEYIALRDAGERPEPAVPDPAPEVARVRARALDSEGLDTVSINPEWALQASAQALSSAITAAIREALTNPEPDPQPDDPLLSAINRELAQARTIIEE